MATSVSLREVTNVQFGPPGILVVIGRTRDGESIDVRINVDDVRRVAPALLEGATIATHYQWPVEGTPVVGGYIVVSQSIPSAAKDTKDALLRVHTVGGTLHLLFPSETAIACGKELQALGIAAAAPPPAQLQ